MILALLRLLVPVAMRGQGPVLSCIPWQNAPSLAPSGWVKALLVMIAARRCQRVVWRLDSNVRTKFVEPGRRDSK